MKLAVISDTHFGYGWGTEREEDAFRNAAEAFDRASDADIILMPGDIFDRKTPRQSVLARAIDIFRGSWRNESSLEASFDGKRWQCDRTPIVAIHGTHERRSDDSVNPIQLLERAGLLTHIHNEDIQFTDGDETVGIHGMSGVPERYAPAVLDRYNPSPVAGAFNVLMLHQSVEQFVYTDDDTEALAVEDMPPGFDYIINGHIHWRRMEMEDDDDRPFIIPGSTVTTQLNAVEAETAKSILTIDTADGSVEIRELSSPRDVTVDEVDVSGMMVDEIVKHIIDTYDLNNEGRRPLLRLTLVGEPATDISAREIESVLADHALVTVSRASTGSRGLSDSADDRSPVQDDGESVDPSTVGDAMIREAVSYERVDDLISLLVDENIDAAFDLLQEHVPADEADDEPSASTECGETNEEASTSEDTDAEAGEQVDETDRRAGLSRFVE